MSYTLHISQGYFMLYFILNDTPTTGIYTLSLHDALPIYGGHLHGAAPDPRDDRAGRDSGRRRRRRPVHPLGRPPYLVPARSEEHTSELQSPYDLVCRLLLEKKKNKS